ncbi:MAG: type II toxin-antitoxin system RelE family toxin [Gammaproteobacteria bacterium]
MPFQVILTPGAEGDLDYFKRFEQRLIVEAFKRYLRNNADVENQHRKQLCDNPLAPWELRLGKYRVFYEIGNASIVRLSP